MADNSRDIQEELASVKALDKLLSQTLDKRLKGAKEANALQDELLKRLREEKDISQDLLDDIENYEGLMEDVLNSKTKGGEALKSQLDRVKEIITVEQQRRDANEKLGDALGDQVDKLENKVKSFPLLGDALAKSIDFDKIKEGAGEMVSKFTNSFTEASMAGQSFAGSLGAGLKAISKGLTLATIKQGIFNAVARKNLYVLIAAAVIALILLIKKLINVGLQFNQQQVDLARNMGISVDQAQEMERAMAKTAGRSFDAYMNSKELMEAQKQIAEATGNSALASDDMLKSQIQLTKFMGLSGEEAVNFQTMAAGAGKSTRELQRDVQGMVVAFNKTTGASLNVKGVMKDIMAVSADVRANFRGNVEELTRAVAQAKLLGTTVDKLAAATAQTLNMESSLQKEMKLRVLTGKNINLDQVRRLKMMGDEAGAAKALTEQMGSIEDFNKMLPHEQKAFADAVGMSTGEMMKMLEAGEMQKKLGVDLSEASAEQIKNNNKLSDLEKEKLLRQKEEMSAQEKMDSAMQQFKDTLNSLMAGPIGDLVGMIAGIFSFIVEVINFLITPIVDFVQMIIDGAKAVGNFFGFGDSDDGTDLEEFTLDPDDKIGDGVITPDGKVVKTDPADFLMALKNPMDMMGSLVEASPLGMVGDAIGGLFGGGSDGIDYDKLAAAMNSQPIQVVIDGKVINEITRKQAMNKSFSKQMG